MVFSSKKDNALFSFNVVLVLVFSAISYLVRGQSADLLRIEYMQVPENDTGISTSRYKFLANVPFRVKNEDYFIGGVEYNKFDVDYSQALPFDTNSIEKFTVIDLNLGYITKWNENWRLVTILTPRLASNFTNGTTSDDFFFNCTATFWKEVKDTDKPFRIVLGLSYNSTAGLPVPLPVISYNKQFHKKWSYTLGIPRMNFRFHPNEDNIVQLALLLDGYFLNIQDDILLPDGRVGSKTSFSALVFGLEYQYKITKQLSFYMLGGKSILQEGILRNDQRNNVYVLNDESNLYFRTGFKVSIF